MKNIMSILILVFMLVLAIFNVKYLSTTYTKVPKVSCNNDNNIWNVYRTYRSRFIEQKMYEKCHKKWLDINHSIKMEWYDDYDCDRFMKKMGERIWNAYQILDVGAFKADFFRLCILYENGGVYVDAHTTPYTSLQEITKGCIRDQEHTFISVLDSSLSGEGIHNGFIISSPKHPFLKKCIERIIKNIENRDYTDGSLSVTGPKCLAYSINEVLHRDKDEKFNLGWNEHGNLSFYLYRFQWGPFQYILKDNDVILSKKYCTVAYAIDKLKPSAYHKKWHNKSIYKK